MKPSSLLQFYAFNAHLIWTLIINERQQQQHATKYMTFWTLSIAFVVCETRNENKEDEKKSKVTNYWIITFCCVCVSVIYCMDLTRFCFFFSLCISWLKPMIFVQLPHFYSYQLCVFFFLVSFHPVHFYLMHVISAIQCTLISFNTDWRNNDDEWEKKTNTHTHAHKTRIRNVHEANEREIPVLCLCVTSVFPFFVVVIFLSGCFPLGCELQSFCEYFIRCISGEREMHWVMGLPCLG